MTCREQRLNSLFALKTSVYGFSPPVSWNVEINLMFQQSKNKPRKSWCMHFPPIMVKASIGCGIQNLLFVSYGHRWTRITSPLGRGEDTRTSQKVVWQRLAALQRKRTKTGAYPPSPSCPLRDSCSTAADSLVVTRPSESRIPFAKHILPYFQKVEKLSIKASVTLNCRLLICGLLLHNKTLENMPTLKFESILKRHNHFI